MNTQMCSIFKSHGQWGVNRINLRYRWLCIKLFVPVRVVWFYPPWFCIWGYVKLSYFIRNDHLFCVSKFFNMVPKSNSIIISPQDKIKLIIGVVFGYKRNRTFLIIITYSFYFTPRLVPGFIKLGEFNINNFKSI